MPSRSYPPRPAMTAATVGSMDWAQGYVADIGYTAGFFRQTTPSHLSFAALTIGRSPGRAIRPRRVLELGFGQGFGLALLAAANPDIAFEGYDFNPDHVAHARKLIEAAGLSNIAVTETSFEDAATRGGADDTDLVAMHGIFSWVSRATQDALITIMRQRLLPEGIAYVSYNCMPGWSPIAPLRQLMLEVKRRNPSGSAKQLALALDLLKELREGGAGYFAANPAAARHFDEMLKSDPTYLAHEYLDEHWELPQFSEVAARMSEAKLTFVASAIIPRTCISTRYHPRSGQSSRAPMIPSSGRRSAISRPTSASAATSIHAGAARSRQETSGTSCPRFVSRSGSRAATLRSRSTDR